jgi:DNA primase
VTLAGRERFDVAAVRHANPIETVVAASGVELTQRGQGFMGRCPFHDDSTASLSVGGVPDRFHCFG